MKDCGNWWWHHNLPSCHTLRVGTIPWIYANWNHSKSIHHTFVVCSTYFMDQLLNTGLFHGTLASLWSKFVCFKLFLNVIYPIWTNTFSFEYLISLADPHRYVFRHFFTSVICFYFSCVVLSNIMSLYLEETYYGHQMGNLRLSILEWWQMYPKKNGMA